MTFLSRSQTKTRVMNFSFRSSGNRSVSAYILASCGHCSFPPPSRVNFTGNEKTLRSSGGVLRVSCPSQSRCMIMRLVVAESSCVSPGCWIALMIMMMMMAQRWRRVQSLFCHCGGLFHIVNNHQSGTVKPVCHMPRWCILFYKKKSFFLFFLTLCSITSYLRSDPNDLITTITVPHPAPVGLSSRCCGTESA